MHKNLEFARNGNFNNSFCGLGGLGNGIHFFVSARLRECCSFQQIIISLNYTIYRLVRNLFPLFLFAFFFFFSTLVIPIEWRKSLFFQLNFKWKILWECLKTWKMLKNGCDRVECSAKILMKLRRVSGPKFM